MDSNDVRSSFIGVKSEANVMCEFSIDAHPIWKKKIKKQQYKEVYKPELSISGNIGGENANGKLKNTKMLPATLVKIKSN